jgi:hypothetical protein
VYSSLPSPSTIPFLTGQNPNCQKELIKSEHQTNQPSTHTLKELTTEFQRKSSGAEYNKVNINK